MDRTPPQAAAGPPASGPKGREARGGAPVSPREIARALDAGLRRREEQAAPPPPASTSAAKSGGIPIWAIAAPVLLLIVAGAGGWMLWKPAPLAVAPHGAPPGATASTASLPASPQSAPAAAAAAAVAATQAALVAPPPAQQATRGMSLPPYADFPIDTATEQHVLNNVTTAEQHGISVFRFKPNPRILVLDFASLHEQGRMLNRAAALIEKTGLPRDRLLDDADLDAAIKAAGDTVETFYYGHDYGAPSLVKFFSLADQENIPLTDEEKGLRRLLRQDDWFAPDTHAALITIPQVGADDHVTLRARATILHHELSHGEYFTNPAYVAFVHHFWKQTLSEAERQQVRKHLRSLGYDQALDDLMENEAQAYLMFTDDAEFFTPEMFGMTKGRLAELRSGFYRSMPPGWLRDNLGVTLGVNKTAAEHE